MLKDRQQTLRSLGRSGRRMYYAVETSAEQKGRISHDLTALIEHWNAVGTRTFVGPISFFIPSRIREMLHVASLSWC